jgi:DUF1009 family protein
VAQPVQLPEHPNTPLGLIAGEGAFPLLVARGARAAGRRVVCCAFDGIADPSLANEVDEFRQVSFVRLASWARFLNRHGCREAIMVGRVKKQTMHRANQWLWIARQMPDWTTLRAYIIKLRKDRRSEAILLTIADELQKKGVTLIDSTTYTAEQLATEGLMGRVEPSERQQVDIDRGWEVCGYLTREDIGQAVAIKDRDVIAVEAVEGTNRMIDRAAGLCRGGGWTLVKRANTRGDMRMDVPTIGVHTIQKLAEARAACLCVEAGKVILLEKQKVIEQANKAGIAIVGRT